MREGWTWHLFQDRYRSYAMDDAHLMVAARFIENKPVKAGLAPALGDHIGNWDAYLHDGSRPLTAMTQSRSAS